MNNQHHPALCVPFSTKNNYLTLSLASPFVQAHEYLAYRRLDRLYHRATFRIEKKDTDKVAMTNPKNDYANRPFLVLSLGGDLFLNGQACRVVGLFIALARGNIDTDFIDCVFDERYPPLVPTPPAPIQGMFSGEALYGTWEGRINAVLCPRECDAYTGGWNDEAILQDVRKWHNTVREHVAETWLEAGIDENGRLVTEKRWTQDVLEPWAKQAREQLKEYRKWKATEESKKNHLAIETQRNTGRDLLLKGDKLLPSLESVDLSVPPLFEKVLFYLRKADASGRWPATTPKRQLVMVSTLQENDSNATRNKLPTSLSVAHIKAKSNTMKTHSAYDFNEGEGGASGSFSVGFFPDSQPKSNEIFPELMKHAFELEIALFPDREPSSTIAINRNAQFRPHTDSGAGAGQSKSLIVGLGDYVGGELMVEGRKNNIRYKGVEFNGWKERHWTMPFRGERFSLVWFTPKGCDGLRGIDLCN